MMQPQNTAISNLSPEVQEEIKQLIKAEVAQQVEAEVAKQVEAFKEQYMQEI